MAPVAVQQSNQPARKESQFLTQARLKNVISKIVSQNGLSQVDVGIIDYISQAAESRAYQVLTNMIRVSQHRTGVSTSRLISKERTARSGYEFKLSAKNTQQKTYDELERLEREIEIELKADLPSEENEDAMSENMDGAKKKKGKGSKRDLPENVKQKMINTTALLAAGGKMKSWMVPSGDAAASSSLLKTSFPVKKKESPPKKGKKDAEKTDDPALKGMRVTQKDRVTLKDALLTLETDPHLSKSTLYYRWLSSLR